MNEIMTITKSTMNDVVNSGGTFSTFDPSSVAGKRAMYKALRNADHKVSEYVNKTIRIADLLITGREYVDTEAVIDEVTGEVITPAVTIMAPYVVIVDDNGETYSSSAKGIFRAVTDLLSVFGPCGNWGEPLEVVVLNVPLADGQHTYTLDLV